MADLKALHQPTYDKEPEMAQFRVAINGTAALVSGMMRGNGNPDMKLNHGLIARRWMKHV